MNSKLLSRRTRQSKKQLYKYFLGIVAVVLFALYVFPVVIDITGRTIDFITGKAIDTKTVSTDILQPPVLDPLPKFVSDDRLTISGRTLYSEGRIEIFVNDSKQKNVQIENYDFKEEIILSLGDNKIKIRAKNKEKLSEFSEEYKVTYIKDEPKLDIDTPQDGSSFKGSDQEITVGGRTDPENTVRINDFQAVVDSEGKFTHILKLAEGENKIKIVAQNQAGKEISKEIIVSYSP